MTCASLFEFFSPVRLRFLRWRGRGFRIEPCRIGPTWQQRERAEKAARDNQAIFQAWAIEAQKQQAARVQMMRNALNGPGVFGLGAAFGPMDWRAQFGIYGAQSAPSVSQPTTPDALNAADRGRLDDASLTVLRSVQRMKAALLLRGRNTRSALASISKELEKCESAIEAVRSVVNVSICSERATPPPEPGASSTAGYGS